MFYKTFDGFISCCFAKHRIPKEGAEEDFRMWRFVIFSIKVHLNFVSLPSSSNPWPTPRIKFGEWKKPLIELKNWWKKKIWQNFNMKNDFKTGGNFMFIASHTHRRLQYMWQQQMLIAFKDTSTTLLSCAGINWRLI